MASLYKRKGTNVWWLKWANPLKPRRARVERFSTGYAIGDPIAYRKAVQLKNEYALKESIGARSVREHPFAQWVVDYLQASHAGSPATLCRYLSVWKTMAAYLATQNIVTPGQITRQVCLAYVPWRLQHLPHLNGRPPCGIGRLNPPLSGKVIPQGRRVCRNTAIFEIKFLSKLLTEAVIREWLPFNPCVHLKLKRDPPRVKDEITDEQFQLIRRELDRRLARAKTVEEKRNADFLSVSFEIAWHQGLRLSETWIELKHVNLQTGLMRIRAKGNTHYEPPINPALRPLFLRLKKEGRRYTYERPHLYGLKWFDFFDALRQRHAGFENISFHSTRVTLESRMERAGAPEAVVMKLLNHSGTSGTTVHRIYRRVLHSEVNRYWSATDTPAAGENRDAPPANPTPTAPSSAGRKEI